MTRKKKFAVLWKHGTELGITLNLPIAMFEYENGQVKSGFEKIKDVELPEPMTSNQFNNFIISDKGKGWAKEIIQSVI